MSGSDGVLLLFAVLTGAGGAGFALALRLHRRNPSTSALALGNVSLFAALLGAGCLAGEVYYRFLYDNTDAYHVSLVSDRWRQRHYRQNNFGVRDNMDYRLELPPGQRRITILGDSFTNGHGVADVDQRFANRLRRAMPDREVHVLAADGLDTGAIVERLRHLVALGYPLDVVLYAYSLNDVSDLIPEWERALRQLYERHPNVLVRNSFLVNTQYYRFRVRFDRELQDYFDLVWAAYEGPLWSWQAQRLVVLQRLISASGGRLVVVTFPFLERLDAAEAAAVHGTLDAFWTDLGVEHLDLLPVYREAGASRLVVSRLDTHPNELAHRIAAEAIHEFLGGTTRDGAHRRNVPELNHLLIGSVEPAGDVGQGARNVRANLEPLGHVLERLVEPGPPRPPIRRSLVRIDSLGGTALGDADQRR